MEKYGSYGRPTNSYHMKINHC